MGEWHWAIQSAVGLNSDNSSRAQFRGTDRCETFEVYPHTADMLSGREVSVETIAKADGALDERIAFASGGNYGAIISSITNFKSRTPCRRFRRRPYTRKRHLSLFRGVHQRAESAVSGGSHAGCDAVWHSRRVLSNRCRCHRCLSDFSLRRGITRSENNIEGGFLTFGDFERFKRRIICECAWSWRIRPGGYATYDVTDQIHPAEDPGNVHIVVAGLEPAKPITGGGLVPDVDGWQTAPEVVIPM